MMLAAVAVIAVLPVPLDGVSGNWPHWRGPDRNGISAERDWSSRGDSEPRWSRELGLGYSCVSIRDGHLLTMGYDLEAGEDVIWCLDPETGAGRWSQRYPAEHLANFHGGGTLTTPTIDGDIVFTTNRYGRGSARHLADGTAVWQRDYKDELGLEVTFHGFSASPLVLGDELFLAFGGTIVAAAKSDGAVRWQTEDYGDGGYSNLVPLTLQGRPCLAAFIGRGLLVLDRTSGEQLHLHPWRSTTGGVNAATPVVIGERVFISSAYNMGCALLEFDADAVRAVWSNRRMRNKVSDCVLWKEHLYGFDESMLKCINLEGEEMWRVRGLGMGALSLADGRLIILSSKGELVIAEASPAGFQELSRAKVLDGGVHWTAPVLHAGLIFCRNSLGQLVCRDHRGEPATTIAAAETAPAGPFPAAPELFARHVEAIGGAAALRAHRSVRFEGEIEILGAGITRTSMTIEQMAPDQWRLTYPIGPAGTVYRGFDGEIGWQLDPFYGNKLYEGAALQELKETTRLYADLEHDTLYTSARTTGEATFGDRPCWVVEAVSAGGSERTLYFDRETGLMVGREGATEAMAVHADYKVFDGIRFPTRTTVLIPDTGAEETYFVSSVTFDDVDPAVFERPAKVLRLLRTPEEIEAENAAARTKHARYLGRFKADFKPYDGEAFGVVIDDGSLALDIPGMGPFALVATDEADRWHLEISAAVTVTFVADDDGAIVAIRLAQPPDRDDELPRVEDPAPTDGE